MKVFNSRTYIDKLQLHFESYFGVTGKALTLDKGPKEKLHSEFFILEIPPNKRHGMFCYCSVGMSADRIDDNKVELVVYSPRSDISLVELITYCASYHRTKLPLNLHHTVNIGQPWLDSSLCNHAFISLPYLEGEELELFQFEGNTIHCYWVIPITESERDYKIANGCEALEQLFEERHLDYLNPNRSCLVSG
ncbi:suppressor of fused domain protein [Flavihumibacter solisilvae]|uniref:Suppressor of fused-like domain-containing protein n=1 Tax=Flavihumibacter solisilvae TaxID=1349421 RepID=A0A0C1IP12_9BACT|nr:suppressor of fused domain protein [Flavihumibacter solisilvae]KIC95950.1 hypothetical protein OI18_03460 [Flavihumibacter solisilvae]